MVPLPTLPPPSDLLPRRPNRFQRLGLEFAGDEEFPAVAGCGPAPPPPLAAVMGVLVLLWLQSSVHEKQKQPNNQTHTTNRLVQTTTV
jgi:hypothetical protein